MAKTLIGRAIKSVFTKHFPDPLSKKDMEIYRPVLGWFAGGNRLETSDEMTFDDYFKNLSAITGLKKLATKHLAVGKRDEELAAAMEFVIEGLHQNSSLSKDEINDRYSYKDMMGSMLGNIQWDRED